MKLSLQSRYTLILVGTVALTVLIVAGTLLTQVRNTADAVAASNSEALRTQLRTQLEHQGAVMAQFLANNLVDHMYRLDLDAIRRLVVAAREQFNVTYVYVQDSDGKLVHDGDKLVRNYGLPMSDPVSKRAGETNTRLKQSNGGNIDIALPILLGGDKLGVVRVGLSLAAITKITQSASDQMAAIDAEGRASALKVILASTFALIALGTIVAVFISARMSKPIQALMAGVARIGKDDLDTPVPAANDKELDRLATEFNRMRDALKSSSQDIEERNVALSVQMTERQALHSRLVQAEKLEAVGRLAGGIAHDFNNQLTAIKGTAELLQLESSEPIVLGHAESIRNSADSSATLVRQLGQNRIVTSSSLRTT